MEKTSFLINHPLKGLVSPIAKDIYEKYRSFISIPKDLKKTDISSEVFLQFLIQEKFYTDAIAFIAHGLTKHAAIEWAHGCVDYILSNEEKLNYKNILDNIKKWVEKPNEENQQVFSPYQEEVSFSLEWLGLAIYWSGSELILEKDVKVPLKETLTAEAITTCIILLGVEKEPKFQIANYQYFIQLGIEKAKESLHKV